MRSISRRCDSGRDGEPVLDHSLGDFVERAAPWSMKMGTIRSPFPHDSGACHARAEHHATSSETFARQARKGMRTESGGYRRDHLRALARRVDVDAKEVGAASIIFTRVGIAPLPRSRFPGARVEAGTQQRRGLPRSRRNRSRHRQTPLLCPRSARHPINRTSGVSSADT